MGITNDFKKLLIIIVMINKKYLKNKRNKELKFKRYHYNINLTLGLLIGFIIDLVIPSLNLITYLLKDKGRIVYSTHIRNSFINSILRLKE